MTISTKYGAPPTALPIHLGALSIMHAYLQALLHYATFQGRTSRKGYWLFLLIQLIILLALSFLERHFALANPEIGFGWITTLYALATLLPVLALQVRRLHDANHAGWWAWLNLLPVIGQLVLLAFALLKGSTDQNRYGPASQ
ncbi:DUF805 domain-containing protein [Paenalcaligenes sp. Me131]|uniref:DUF805 domain-containing protein n=1 Tax=Paenalcaligenes sp. Me131 TaxID=3392636 RepID=UPI003D2765AE